MAVRSLKSWFPRNKRDFIRVNKTRQASLRFPRSARFFIGFYWNRPDFDLPEDEICPRELAVNCCEHFQRLLSKISIATEAAFGLHLELQTRFSNSC